MFSTCVLVQGRCERETTLKTNFVAFPFVVLNFSPHVHEILIKIKFLRFPKKLWISQDDEVKLFVRANQGQYCVEI